MNLCPEIIVSFVSFWLLWGSLAASYTYWFIEKLIGRFRSFLFNIEYKKHEMVPFHDRWVQNWFKDQKNVEEMQRRLHTNAKSSNEWLTELVNEMLVSPDTPPTPEFNTERVSEALTERDFLHSGIFKTWNLYKNRRQVNRPHFWTRQWAKSLRRLKQYRLWKTGKKRSSRKP